MSDKMADPAGGRRAVPSEVMAPAVEVVRRLTEAAAQLPERFGRQPAPSSKAMEELKADRVFARRSTWSEPARDTHALGAVAILAASDGLRSYACLFDCEHPPGFTHLVVAQMVLQASVVAAWLNEPSIPLDERVRRGLVERLHMGSRQAVGDPAGVGTDTPVERFKTVGATLRWPVLTGRGSDDIAVGDTKRPTIEEGAILLLSNRSGTAGSGAIRTSVQEILRGSWYSLDPALESPPIDGADRSRQVLGQAGCLIRLYLAATENQVELMGWESTDWRAAADAARQLGEELAPG